MITCLVATTPAAVGRRMESSYHGIPYDPWNSWVNSFDDDDPTSGSVPSAREEYPDTSRPGSPGPLSLSESSIADSFASSSPEEDRERSGDCGTCGKKISILLELKGFKEPRKQEMLVEENMLVEELRAKIAKKLGYADKKWGIYERHLHSLVFPVAPDGTFMTTPGDPISQYLETTKVSDNPRQVLLVMCDEDEVSMAANSHCIRRVYSQQGFFYLGQTHDIMPDRTYCMESGKV